jgi:RimJ/RimL family protein N-acetyltransferase
MSEEFYIRALCPPDWEDFRSLRLEALKSHPGLFGSRYDDECALPTAHWQDILNGKSKQIFGLYQNHILRGITAIFTDREDSTGQTAILAMSYIQPAYRGKKLSRLMYQARIDWAKQQPQFKQIIVGHRESNEASRRANQAFGFEYTGNLHKVWPDGTTEDQCQYILRISHD